MYARVVQFEGGEAEAMSQSTAEIKSQAESGGGPPPGVPAKEFLFLQDTAAGKTMVVVFFETEDDYRQGDATLSEMSPPGGGLGNRVAVEKYEVAVRVEA